MDNTNAAAMATQTEILGYAIEQTGNRKAPYILRGVRGGVYGLMRYGHDGTNDLMYVINLSNRSKGTIVALKGNSTFTDRDGRLTCYNGHY